MVIRIQVALQQERMFTCFVRYTSDLIILCNLYMIDCLPCKCNVSSALRSQFDLNTPAVPYDNPFVEAILEYLYPSINLVEDENVQFSDVRDEFVMDGMENDVVP